MARVADALLFLDQRDAKSFEHCREYREAHDRQDNAGGERGPEAKAGIQHGERQEHRQRWNYIPERIKCVVGYLGGGLFFDM